MTNELALTLTLAGVVLFAISLFIGAVASGQKNTPTAVVRVLPLAGAALGALLTIIGVFLINTRL